MANGITSHFCVNKGRNVIKARVIYKTKRKICSTTLHLNFSAYNQNTSDNGLVSAAKKYAAQKTVYIISFDVNRGRCYWIYLRIKWNTCLLLITLLQLQPRQHHS
jgi:hypothetical protein